MIDLNDIVIPEVKNVWQEVAEALHYSQSDIESIRQKELNDPKRCCKEFLRDWLRSKHGTGPKVWSTLLNAIKNVKEISFDITEDIIAKVKQLN